VQIGGNLESFPDGRILLTVGDHQFDGWYRSTNLITDMSAHYGKTVLLDAATGDTEIYTVGHRNPQGLVVDLAGRVWSTEHGPQGGDELNLLQAGRNYGYPFHTYGTEYGSAIWPPQASLSAEPDYEKPTFAWVPSIGISDLVEVNDSAFSRWQNDLLISSLRARRLWRVRMDEGRVVYAEPIDVGERIRDIAAGKGEFVLWTDSNTIVRVRSLDTLDDGSALFAVRCGGCHDDSEHRIGPALRGFLVREIGSAEGYVYSSSLRSLSGQWTDELLDAFIADPATAVPGNKMVFAGIDDAEERRKIVEYLKAVD
jgi:cytochrome c2